MSINVSNQCLLVGPFEFKNIQVIFFIVLQETHPYNKFSTPILYIYTYLRSCFDYILIFYMYRQTEHYSLVQTFPFLCYRTLCLYRSINSQQQSNIQRFVYPGNVYLIFQYELRPCISISRAYIETPLVLFLSQIVSHRQTDRIIL